MGANRLVFVYCTNMCEDNTVYVRVAKKCGTRADEESYVIKSGNTVVVTSLPFADDEFRENEYCLPQSTDSQYTFLVKDS